MPKLTISVQEKGGGGGGGVISLPRNTARSLKINKSSVTIMQRIFEINSSFHVEYRTTGKV